MFEGVVRSRSNIAGGVFGNIEQVVIVVCIHDRQLAGLGDLRRAFESLGVAPAGLLLDNALDRLGIIEVVYICLFSMLGVDGCYGGIWTVGGNEDGV